MSEPEDDEWLTEFPVDHDYIDVEERVAAVEQSDEYRYDASHTYDRSDNALFGTARDVQIDRRRVVDRDDRGGTRTGFDPNEASDGHLGTEVVREGKRQTYAQWLRTLQDGFRSKERYAENMAADRQRYVDALASQLDLTDFQQERTRAIANDVNMSHMAHYPTELVVLAITSIVANEDDRWIRDEDRFRDLVRDLDGSMEDVKNARILVKEKSGLV